MGGRAPGDPLCPLPGDGSEGSTCWQWGCAGTSAVGMLGCRQPAHKQLFPADSPGAAQAVFPGLAVLRAMQPRL